MPLTAGTLLYGQEFRASLTGRVLDSAGVPIANAKIRLTNLTPREMKLTVYRIDRSSSWSNEKLELVPIEVRDIDAKEN